MDENYVKKLKGYVVRCIPGDKGINFFTLSRMVGENLPDIVGKATYKQVEREEISDARLMGKVLPPGFFRCIDDLQNEGKIVVSKEGTVSRKKR